VRGGAGDVVEEGGDCDCDCDDGLGGGEGVLRCRAPFTSTCFMAGDNMVFVVVVSP
jgi:hypothetical protein